MAEQKKPIPPGHPGGWWIRLAKPLVRDYKPGFVQLGKEMAKAVGRSRAYTHSPLSRFVATGECSVEIATAISAVFNLPRPAFVARSRDEAVEMMKIAEQFDGVVISDIDAEIIELEERVAELRARREEEARAKQQQQQAPKQRQARR